jgi:hypothetical protein
MRQEQQMQSNMGITMRVWLYISKPFQISKVLEILYALDWMWYALLSLLPPADTSGLLFTTAQLYLPHYAINAVMVGIACIHALALLGNIVWLRKINLIFNIFILCYLAANILIQSPISSGAGYLVILVGVTIFSFLRMDETM